MSDDDEKVETFEEWAARMADTHVQLVDQRRSQDLSYIASMTCNALWGMPVLYGQGRHPVDRHPDAFFMSNGGEKALAFGRANGWPPAEAFARERVFGVEWSASAWANDCFYRLGIEMAVGALKAFDAAHKELDAIRRERTAGLRLPRLDLEGCVVRFDPDTREPTILKFDGMRKPEDKAGGDGDQGGAPERATQDDQDGAPEPGVSPEPDATPGPSTPPSAVKGIGDKLEARLHAVGVQSVEALAELSAAGDDEGPAGDEARLQAIKDADPDLFERLNTLILSARKHLYERP
jgi:hypothetical protein